MTRRIRKATPKDFKHCITCDKVLPLTDFGWRNKSKNARRHHCNNCRNLSRWIMRRVKYEYGQLLEKQKHKCAICDVLHTQSRLSIDHDHKTQRIRGLLCHDCNSGIASFDDDKQYLARAILYLIGDRNDNNGIYISSNNISNTSGTTGIRS
jgi:uncharacterized protein YlaI